jgi:hypothetical protein
LVSNLSVVEWKYFKTGIKGQRIAQATSSASLPGSVCIFLLPDSLTSTIRSPVSSAAQFIGITSDLSSPSPPNTGRALPAGETHLEVTRQGQTGQYRLGQRLSRPWLDHGPPGAGQPGRACTAARLAIISDGSVERLGVGPVGHRGARSGHPIRISLGGRQTTSSELQGWAGAAGRLGRLTWRGLGRARQDGMDLAKAPPGPRLGDGPWATGCWPAGSESESGLHGSTPR